MGEREREKEGAFSLFSYTFSSTFIVYILRIRNTYTFFVDVFSCEGGVRVIRIRNTYTGEGVRNNIYVLRIRIMYTFFV